MIATDKSIYSLVLSDSVVEAVDIMARSAGLSRSAMINQLLAERVAYVTPEMRLRDILAALQSSMNGEFYLAEQSSGSTLSCRSTLKYRYKPTIRYSVEIYSRGGQKAGELRVSFRTRSAELTEDLTGFFGCWAALERKYIAAALNRNIVYAVENGRFSRTLSMPSESISAEELGMAVADYMAMFDGAMKRFFSELPDVRAAAAAAEEEYAHEIIRQSVII